MNKTLRVTMGQAAWLLLAASALTACTPVEVTTNYASLSTHTLQVAADKQADVVWLQQFKDGEFIVMRCYNGEAPQCVRAKTP